MVHERAGPRNTKTMPRWRDADRNARSASGDPAMVFIFRMASILSAVTGTLPCPAAGLLLDVGRAWSIPDDALAHDRLQKIRSPLSGRSCENARIQRAYSLKSTTNVMLFEQRLVTRLVLPLDVVEKGAAGLHELQKAAA